MPKKKKKSKVVDLRFARGRYEEAGFPLDTIEELGRYQALLRAVAAQIWRTAHPERERLPRDFDSSVRLRLTRLKSGSVIPVLAPPPEDEVLGDDASIRDLVHQSVDYIDAAFEEIVSFNTLPADVSEDSRKAFRALGASFKDEERVIFRASSETPLIYTQEDRGKLIASLDAAVDLPDAIVVGQLVILDSRHRFSILDTDGRLIPGSFEHDMWDNLHALHKAADDSDYIWISGPCQATENGTVRRFENVTQCGLFGSVNDPATARLADLASLPSGWFDGDGSRVESSALLPAQELAARLVTEGLSVEGIFPDVEGGVRFEWLRDNAHTVALIDNDGDLCGWHTDVENGVRLSAQFGSPDEALAWVQENVR